MLFKNRLLASLVLIGLFLSLSTQANAKTSEISYNKNDYKQELSASQLSFLHVKLLDNSKPTNAEVEKLKRKPFNKKVYRKIKRFLKKKKIRRKRRIIAENSTPNYQKNQMG